MFISSMISGHPDQLIQQAVELHRAGNVAEAEALFRQVLALDPASSDAHNSLGILANIRGDAAVAIEHIRSAIALKPAEPAFHANLGIILAAEGRMDEAAKTFAAASHLNPNDFKTAMNLGNALEASGQSTDAADAFSRAAEIDPSSPEAHFNLANNLIAAGQHVPAIDAYRKALALRPDYFEAATNLGFALHDRADLTEAIATWQSAADRGAIDARLFYALGTALRESGQTQQAITYLRKTLELQPDFAEASNNLGLALREEGLIDDAIQLFNKVIATNNNFGQAWNNLAMAMMDAGRMDEAFQAFSNAVDRDAGIQAASNRLYCMLFNPRFSPTEILAEHRLWNDRFARPLRPAHLSYLPDLTPDRRLRVGFVSPNFRNHVVGRFMLPFCNFHDHRAFEFYFYDDSKSGDAVTGQLRSSAEIWRQTAALSDDELSTAISQDRIDILVDLNMHMEGSRLLAFARKPAPVQVTYLAYAGTTGLGTMDYRLTDPFLDPPGDSDRLYSERSIRLAQSYWCYPPPDEAPTVGPLPVARSGHITFGCLNSFSKINPPVLELWAAILRRTPNSHLLLHAPEGTRRQEVRNRLAQHDISSERISFVPRSSGRDYFSQYLRIDIGLDPFPYPGGTTTCDALWMGVPVVTLAGQGAIARAGVSILNNVGLPHLIANSQPDYLQIATGIASDIPWLQTVRATLRPAMRGSPLMDPQRFTQDVEAAFKKMWMNYILDGDAPPQSGGEPTFPSSLSPADP